MVITLALSLLANNLFSQSGTLLVGIIFDDGIYIASDSRGSLFGTDDYTKEPIAYIDSLPKIFLLNKLPVAVAGNSQIGKKYCYQVISDFNRTLSVEDNIQISFSKFKKYLNTKYPIDSFPDRKREGFMSGGYFNGNPHLIGFDSSGDIILEKGMLSSDGKALKNANKLHKPNNQKDVITLLEGIIYDFAKDMNKTNTIGGPISIVKITPNNKVYFLKNDFRNREYASVTDFTNAVISNKIKLFLVGNNTRNSAIKIFEMNADYKGHK